MKGGAGTAQMFGEIFRNIFGWNVTRPSALDKELFNDLYKMYVEDENHLGIYEYFSRVNPASYQSMTAVLLESARKGYWKATQEQLEKTAGLHAKMTTEQGAACTEFVCGNDKLRSYVANQLEGQAKESYARVMKSTLEKSAGKEVVLKEQKIEAGQQLKKSQRNGIIIGALVCVAFVALAFLVRKRNKQEG
jgi:cobaltochelatase CobN